MQGEGSGSNQNLIKGTLFFIEFPLMKQDENHDDKQDKT